MKKYLYLMRHGETLFNVRHKIQGWCDAPLTDLGKKQAKVVKEYFNDNNITFDHAYSSTSERACDTLELITDMNYTRLKGLKEWNFGIFEGESEDLVPPLPFGDFFKTFGGEGEMDMRERFASTIKSIMDDENCSNVLIVSHGAAIIGFTRYWSKNQQIQVSSLQNCGILIFEYEDEEFSLIKQVKFDPC